MTREELATIKARIRALLEKAQASAGCTEAEALAAAEKAAELMGRYGISADAAERPPLAEVEVVSPRTHQHRPWVYLWSELGACCGVRVMVGGASIFYFGFEPDALTAEYLHVVLRRCVDRARAEFRDSPEYKRRRTKKTKARASDAFTAGFVVGLVRKLRHVAAGRMPAQEKATRDRLIQEHLDAAGKQLSEHKPRGRFDERHAAFDAGRAAGAATDIHWGIDGDKPPLMIEGPKP